jgi:bifunctional non-homologous end joining protein LigD
MTSEHITLYFKQGSSDKVYNASLEEVENNRFVVNFAYGRRGATLTTGTKTNTPLVTIQRKASMTNWCRAKPRKATHPAQQARSICTPTRISGTRASNVNY